MFLTICNLQNFVKRPLSGDKGSAPKTIFLIYLQNGNEFLNTSWQNVFRIKWPFIWFQEKGTGPLNKGIKGL